MLNYLYSLMKQKKFSLILIFLISAVVLLLVPQWQVIVRTLSLFDFFSTEMLSSLWYFLKTAFLSMNALAQIIFIGTSILLSLNIILLIKYIQVYRKLLNVQSTGLSAFGLIAAVFTTGCLSCSVIFIAPLISIFGVSTGLFISNNSQIIAFLALISIGFSCFLLLKKITDPQVCNTNYA